MEDRRLPTRVSNACDWCRRQKQRVSTAAPSIWSPSYLRALLKKSPDSAITFVHVPIVSRPTVVVRVLKLYHYFSGSALAHNINGH